MNQEDVQKLSNAANAKITLLKNDFFKYFMRAIMAGFFIVVAMIFSNVVGNVFSGAEEPAWGKFLGALVFSIAVLLISLVGGELFTGNNLVMAFGAFDKKISWGDAAKVWVVSYIGNFVGCLILSLIFVWAGASGTADYFAGFIGNKLAIPAGQMFFRAVLCNFFVCLGVLCGIKLKSEVAKFLMIVMCISGFVVSGFEHCVANMYYIPAGLLAKHGEAYYNAAIMAGMTPDQLNSMTVGKFFLNNLLPVTLGNIVGGVVFVALPLYLIYRNKNKAEA